MFRPLLRTLLFLAALIAAGVGVIALTAPSPLALALGFADPDLAQVATPLGLAVLLATAAVVLRGARKVEYVAVRHEHPAPIKRPTPAQLRPKVAKKVRAKVRADAGDGVRRSRPR